MDKITRKLCLYFGGVLLVFSVIIGVLVFVLFQNHTLNIHKAQLQERAEEIATTLNRLMSEGRATPGMGLPGVPSGGLQGEHQPSIALQGSGVSSAGVPDVPGDDYSSYLNFIDEIAGADAWVLDENLEFLTRGNMKVPMQYDELPENVEEIIADVFAGETVFSQEMSPLLPEQSISVGVPIGTPDGEILGAVVLHDSIESIHSAAEQGVFMLLLSIAVALVGGFVLVVVFSSVFTKPLKVMKCTAMRLSEGDYTAQNNIVQADEIGDLAVTMDELAHRLALAKEESARLDILRNEFLANVSHELKTPVTVMRGSLEALVDGVIVEAEQVTSYHVEMLREAKFLQRLVGDLLDLSRLQSLDFKLENNQLAVGDLLEDAMRSAQHLASAKSIALTLSVDQPGDTLWGDYGRLRQMLLIVLDNAVKFSPVASEISLVYTQRTLTITDHGVGIAPDYLPHIFQRFYKSSSEENKTGTGLGLAIAQQIAQRSDISITAESTLGVGTVFTFQFPAEKL